MTHYQIVVGSVLGASEYVADALQETLHSADHKADIFLHPDLALLDKHAIWIICTSTHGAGDLPDNIQPLAAQLNDTSLEGVKYLIVGLGDSSYDTFCNGAIQMQSLLNKRGATLLHAPLHIDVLNHPIPEDIAIEWLTEYLAEGPTA